MQYGGLECIWEYKIFKLSLTKLVSLGRDKKYE